MKRVANVTIRAMMDRRAREEPEHVYCIFQDRPYTFGEVDDAVNRVANGLLALGLAPGDRVALMLPSHPDHVIAIFALAKIGLVRVPVNVHLKGAALDYLFEQLDPRALIADASYEEVLQPVLEKHTVEKVIWRGDARKGSPSYRDLAQTPDNAPPPVAPQSDDILALTPSSGTTGPPKGVLKSDRTLRTGPIGILELTGAKAGDVFLFWEAMHHGAGVAVLIAAVVERITIAILERFSASQFWREARHYRATHIHYLGSVVPMLLKQPPGPDDRAHEVRIAWGGGCPPDAWRPLEERFGVRVREGYGLSEMLTFVTINPDGPTGSIGKALSCFEVKLIDDDGAEAPAGERGEIIVRAREHGLHFLGYFRNEEATQAALRGEWFCTGDLGRRDTEGYLYFLGRRKDSVRRRGVNISAWEVERIVAEHPDVEECALIGVPSELGEDELKIFVRPVSGQQLEPLDLITWCEPRMPYFQIPRYVAFIDEFPKTPTQRIQKRELSRSTGDCWDLERSGYTVGRKQAS